jgi:NitT/TauT family transport system permease protein
MTLPRRFLTSVLPPVVTLIVLMAVWEGVARYTAKPYLLPSPMAIHAAANEQAGVLARAALVTGEAAVLGFACSAVIGVLAAVILSSSRWVERAFYPFTVFLQTVPLVAIAPLLVVWYGNGLKAVVIAAFIVSLFPVIANTLNGLRSVDPALIDLFRLYGASPPARLFKLKLPSALPNIFTGLRISAGLAVIGTIVGELVAGSAGDDAGLGVLIMTYMREFGTDRMFAAVGLAAVLGLVLFGAVNLTGYLMLRRWHASAQER